MANKFDLFFESNYGVFLSEESISLPYEKVENKNNTVEFSSDAGINKNSSDELVHPVQDDKPPVEGKPRYIAKRNRRLRSKYRNIQLFDTKTNKWADDYRDTRFRRIKDANAAIEKMNPSD